MFYPEKESATLELKQGLTDGFLKTVSAFANYGDGRIVFGAADDGGIVGVDNEAKLRLQIENKINDNINPRPQFTLDQQRFGDKDVVILTVFKGKNAPYYYKQSTYKRSDTSTTPIDRTQLLELVLGSTAIDYDQLLSSASELSFEVLAEALKREVGLQHFSDDTLRTLGLMVEEGYTIAGELLADEHDNARSGTDIVRFGKTSSEFMERKDVTKQSLLVQYQAALAMFDKWYAPYEQVVGFTRIERIQIPREAFRESMANALVNRRYDVNGRVQVAMYDNRIEITSPGGLPEGMSERAYLYTQLSIPRNTTIANVFHRLHIIEKFGTGIDRIRAEYLSFNVTPEFDISDQFIRVVLPVIDYNAAPKEESVRDVILMHFSTHHAMSRAALEEATGYKRSTVLRELRQLISEDLIEVVGKGPATTYRLKL